MIKDLRPKPLDIALVGYGDIARRAHGPQLADRPDLFWVRAVADQDHEALTRARQTWPAAEVARSIDALDLSAVDAGVVLTSDGHLPALTSLVAARKPTLVEKPLCFSPEAGRAIRDRAAVSNVPIVVGYMRRYCGAMRRALKWAQNLSEPINVTAELLHPTPREAPEPASGDAFRSRLDALVEAYSLESILGSSIAGREERMRSYFLLITSGIHLLNLMRCVLGGALVVEDGSIHKGGLAGELAVSGDRGLAVLRWTFSAGCPYSESLCIKCENEDLHVDFPSVYSTGVRHTTVVLRARGQRSVWSSQGVGFAEEYRAFFEVVRRGERPATGAGQAVEDLETALRGVALARMEPS